MLLLLLLAGDFVYWRVGGVDGVGANFVGKDLKKMERGTVKRNKSCFSFPLACRFNVINTVATYLDSPLVDPNTLLRDETGFYIACSRNYLELVKLLLGDERVDVNKTGPGGNTPFMFACDGGHVEIIQCLIINERVDINRTNGIDDSPLLRVCRHGYFRIAKCLLSSPRIDVTPVNVVGKNAFMIACQHGNTKIAKLFLGKIDINVQDEHGNTALMLIRPIIQNAFLIKTLLEDDKTNVNLRNKYGETVSTLWFKTDGGPACELIKTMLQRNDVDYTNTNYVSDAFKHPEQLKLLLASRKIPVREDSLQAYIVAKQKDLSVVKMFLERPEIDVNYKGVTQSIVTLACKYKFKKVAKLLLKHKNIDINYSLSNFPLHYCVCYGWDEHIVMIVKNKHFERGHRSNNYIYFEDTFNNGNITTRKLLYSYGFPPLDELLWTKHSCRDMTVWPSFLPEWTRFTAWRYPEVFNQIARAWLLSCKRTRPKISKDMRYLILEHIARNWRRTKYKLVQRVEPVPF